MDNDKITITIPNCGELSDVRKFIFGFRELATQCNLTSVEYISALSLIKKLNFADDTSCGIFRLFTEAGIIKKE